MSIDVQPHADAILASLAAQIRDGTLVLHFQRGQLVKVTTTTAGPAPPTLDDRAHARAILDALHLDLHYGHLKIQIARGSVQKVTAKVVLQPGRRADDLRSD